MDVKNYNRNGKKPVRKKGLRIVAFLLLFIGVVLAVFAIVAGIIAIVTRKGEGKGPFVAGGFYLAGGIIGLAMAGSYADLKIWGVACIIFALVFIIGTILEKKRR